MLCGRHVIPAKFQRYAGFKSYQFGIENGHPYQDISDPEGWRCSIKRDDGWLLVRLLRTKFPCEIEVLQTLARIDGECEREYRYVRIHSAYECLFDRREKEFSAIRHALAHPAGSLRDRSVVESLEARFGGTRLDLRKYGHQKEIYRCIGQMLMAIDQELCRRIVRRWADVVICSLSE